MVAAEREDARRTTTLLSAESPDKIIAEIKKCQYLTMPARYAISLLEIDQEKIYKTLRKTYERQPEDF